MILRDLLKVIVEAKIFDLELSKKVLWVNIGVFKIFDHGVF